MKKRNISRYVQLLLVVCLSIVSCEKNPAAYELPDNNDDDAAELRDVKVQTVKVNGNWRLYKDGELFYIRGAGFSTSTYEQPDYYSKMLVDYGGNTIRTYGISETTGDVLDAAHANGLSVAVGLWVNREADGFDYDNEELVQQQLDKMRADVLKYKDHPAVLLWMVGNESEARYTNLKLWDAINDICAMIHEVDPDHPTTTALAGANPDNIRAIVERAPELDILSINSYAPQMPTILSNVQSAGWTKPYMVTEFGPRGTWQMNPEPDRILPWGDPSALVEQTSTEKAEIYRSVYQDHILSNVNNGCIGSFVFVMGYQTHGEVRSWYGLNNREGRAFGALDVMQFGWTGNYPTNRAPNINSREDMLLNGQRADDVVRVSPGSSNIATIKANDPDGDPLEYEWLIAPEHLGGVDGGPHQGIPNLIEDSSKKNITFTAPSKGAYRLYVYVKDDHNKVAMAVVPFLVE